MTYNKFKKLAQVKDLLGVNHTVTTWLPNELKPFAVSNFLLQSLEEAQNEPLGTEKAKSEHIITPILKELRRNNPDKFSAF